MSKLTNEEIARILKELKEKGLIEDAIIITPDMTVEEAEEKLRETRESKKDKYLN